MEKADRFKQGFFFTILALIVVSFIFVSVQLWAQTVQVEEARAAERFKVEALRTTLELIDNESINRFSKASMAYAMERLAVALNDHEDLSVYGITSNTTRYPDGTGNLNVSIYELMANGNTSAYLMRSSPFSCAGNANPFYPNCSNLTYNSTEQKYILKHYFNQTATAARILGYDLVWGNPTGFSFNQTSLWNVTMKYNVTVTLTDRNKLVSITKLMAINLTMDIQGFTDPYVGRMDKVYRPNPSINLSMRPHRNIYHIPNYSTPSDAQARNLQADGAAVEGMGWFFGPTSSDDNASFTTTDPVRNITKINQFIYVTSSPSKAVEQSAYFGAIVLEVPGYTESSRDYVQGGCNYTETNQTNCIYCTRKVERKSSAGCSANTNYYLLPESIPINQNIPYIALIGGLQYPRDANYHWGAKEVLFSSNANQTNTTRSLDPNTFAIQWDDIYKKFSTGSNRGSNVADSKVWDLNGPRDMAICGYYVKSDYGPSYLQRFTEIPYKGYDPAGYYSSSGLGIESFVTGRWAGGSDDPIINWSQSMAQDDRREQRSRVDYQFYHRPNFADQMSTDPVCIGSFIKGMPGCKNYNTCSNADTAPEAASARVQATGRFAIANKTAVDPNPAQRYNLTKLWTEQTSLNPQACK